jgi:rhomboid family GlyGly-CTERM serine protease
MTAATILQVRHGGRSRLPWRSLLLAALAIGAWTVYGPAPEAWVYDRLTVGRGEWWRLLTAHWVHSDGSHLLWDVSALLLFGMLFEARLGWQLPLALLAGTIGVDTWLWWGASDLRYYCGLSGVLNAVLVLGLLELWREQRHPLLPMTLAGAALKILLEMQLGEALLTRTAWPSVPAAHAAGYVSGWLLYLAGAGARKAFSASRSRSPSS